MMLTRRSFVKGGVACSAMALVKGCVCGNDAGAWQPEKPWKGFNFVDMLKCPSQALHDADERIRGYFPEEEFLFLRDWGFNFARLALDYRCFTKDGDWERFDEAQLAKLDAAVEYGRQHGIHVQICLHRIPGFCIIQPKEPRDLFYDPLVQGVACDWWKMFARRYRGIPNERLSFNLFNEPPYGLKDQSRYPVVARKLVEAIRDVDPTRYIVADGYHCGRKPIPELDDIPGLAYGFHVYDPREISHYRVVDGLTFPDPCVWPPAGVKDGVAYLRERYYRVWEPALAKGRRVVCGEIGVTRETPQAAALGWVEDNLKLLNEYGMGYAFWSLVGDMGVLNNGRKDVPLEDFHGYKLDRQLLELLREYL